MTGPFPLPSGTCDTHVHFYDATYPAAPTTVLRPPDATPAEYRDLQAALGMQRLVVVQPTTYGLDNRCQLAAMAAFGESARGVMVVDADIDASELTRLTELGVRGARFHMLAGGAVGWDALDHVAERIGSLGWHIQLQINGLELDDRLDRLRRLPVDLVVDHIGRFMPPGGVDHPGFEALLTLLDEGRTWIKLSAPYESSPDHDAVLPLVDELVRNHPDRLVWATNWPHPGQATPPSPSRLAELCHRWLPTDALRRQVLVDNPIALYGFRSNGS